MSWFSSSNTWGARDLFGKTCPPVTDCKVKNTLMGAASEQRKKQARQAKKADRRARSGGGSWPFGGSWGGK